MQASPPLDQQLGAGAHHSCCKQHARCMSKPGGLERGMVASLALCLLPVGPHACKRRSTCSRCWRTSTRARRPPAHCPMDSRGCKRRTTCSSCWRTSTRARTRASGRRLPWSLGSKRRPASTGCCPAGCKRRASRCLAAPLPAAAGHACSGRPAQRWHREGAALLLRLHGTGCTWLQHPPPLPAARAGQDAPLPTSRPLLPCLRSWR